MDISGREVLINYVEPKPSRDDNRRLAMDYYINHVWLANVLDPLAPVVAPALYPNIHHHWNLPVNFNPYSK